MPRFSSLRSGLLLTLFLAVFGYGTFAFAQTMGSAMDAKSGDPGANGAQQGSIVNVGSGIDRKGSSLGAVQALLYGDANAVIRFNVAKIDYESLAKFVDEFVDKAGGSVRSDDKYLSQLRDYQKSSAKSSFKELLSVLQRTIVQEWFNKKIDDAYIVQYGSDNGDGCVVFAIPTDGLSDADQKTATDAIHGLFSPITIFNRYGFIVAVIRHDAAVPVDLEAIQSAYLAKMRNERSSSAYGSYGAAQGANNGAFGSNGSEFGAMRSDSFGGSGSLGSNSSGSNSLGSGSFGIGDSQNVAVQNPKYPNVLGLSPKLYAEYVQEATEAEEKAQASARRSTLPYVRRRFEKPATAEESATLFDALRQVDGAVVGLACVDPNLLKSTIEKQTTSNDSFDGSFSGDSIAQPFSALGSEDSQENSVATEVFSSVFNAKGETSWKTASLALSLVGSPKLTLVATFADEESAKTEATALQGAFALAKPAVKKALDDAASDAEEKVDFSPLVNSLFEGMKPQVRGAKVAVVLDSAIIQEHAGLFLALLGGTETKSELEQESEEIDWSLGEKEKAVDATTKEADAQADNEEEDEDPFAEESETKPAEDDAKSDPNEDDPFGSDDDPFAE